MLNTKDFASVEELDKAYSEHLDSLVVGGFMERWTPEYAAFISTWAEAVANLEEELSKPRDYSQL